MPVTINPSENKARRSCSDKVSSADELLRHASPSDHERCKKIIASCFNDVNVKDTYGNFNGFLFACMDAYNHHHHLTIRPEDVWFAILTQLGFYINAHAEELRSFFVAHEGSQFLDIKYGEQYLEDLSYPKVTDFPQQIMKEMAKRFQDPELFDWIKPNFSTSTQEDVIVASICMMGAMDKYFGYGISLGCGLSSVTLLGEKEDWIKLLERIEIIPRFGSEPSTFHSLLEPVLKYFVRSFDEPRGEEVESFWGRIAKRVRNGSGPRYISGWLTAFCFWNKDGKLLWRDAVLPVETEASMRGRGNAGCDLDGTLYHRLDDNHIPAGSMSVPVRVNENGRVRSCKLVAGSVGVKASSSGEPMDTSRYKHGYAPSTIQPLSNAAIGLDSLQPVSGWWMYEVLNPQEMETKLKNMTIEERRRLVEESDRRYSQARRG